ncbi:hypothetical protein NDU88_001642 [Pleurodeles waltl]|uniref:Uncharacterized protein n=1 Tax=Pleurodeles waltl TaxID=8319 RepID=A0AAV7WPZ5_PLEWA|nr:hypothetical protein NDU88_001642 [Pleurodeles waltl]
MGRHRPALSDKAQTTMDQYTVPTPASYGANEADGPSPEPAELLDLYTVSRMQTEPLPRSVYSSSDPMEDRN